FGANIKQIPTSSRQREAVAASTAGWTPSADKTSALPVELVAALFPCFATGTPAPATTNAAAVETLNVFTLLPPVPTTSTNFACFVLIFVQRSRMTRAIA